jgi:hypothetical protein
MAAPQDMIGDSGRGLSGAIAPMASAVAAALRTRPGNADAAREAAKK